MEHAGPLANAYYMLTWDKNALRIIAALWE